MTSVPDRADVVATAALQIIRDDLVSWLRGKPVTMSDTHRSVAVYLRDEFSDIEQAAIDQFRQSQPD
jgi:hypothetical protein